MRVVMRKQEGAVLVVSLILLLLITVIAISTMSSATFQTTMVINAQQREEVFRSAESAAEQALTADSMVGANNAYLANGNAPKAYGVPAANLHTPATDISMSADLYYKGRGTAAVNQELSGGGGAQLVSKIYEARGSAATTDAAVASDAKVATQIIQGVGIVSTDSGRETYDP